jgi:ubiquinone/menaquinone biosynthesis C-methylase UbiE
MKNIKISKNIQSTYDNQYTDKITQWRELGGKYKSQNIIKIIGEKSFQKVLDFGAGEGSVLTYLDKNNQFKELYALEISDSGIAQIKNRELENLKELRKFDGYTTEYSDNEFDLIYCSHVIEHVEHPRLVLREIKRISKFQVFEIPLDYSKNVDSKMGHFLGYGHINIFTPSLFKFLLKSEGFEIENEIHSDMDMEILEFNWYHNQKLKKTFKRKILAHLITNKSKIAKMLFGKEKSKEFYHAAYTCFTSHSGDLKIF